MKISEYNTKDGGRANPCELVSKYLLHLYDGGTLETFVKTFDFYSRDELERGIRHLIEATALDPYMSDKHLKDDNPRAYVVYLRAFKLMTDQSRISKYPTALAGDLWHGYFTQKNRDERVARLFGSITPSAERFAQTCERIKAIYSLSDDDIEKLHFFVEQTKAGAAFPNSLRRMLYIWGTEKMTGKTTSATMLVSFLNGDLDESNIAKYSTTLANEMQFGNFNVPRISECSVCLMDECFYADMGKTYADFKRFLTSSNGRARLPYGQEFEWRGCPNYIATSNDSLQKFIKDWGDRRYLSVEFRAKPTETLGFPEIHALWFDFVTNSTRTKEWREWADDLAAVSNEIGERAVASEEFEIELRQISMITKILDLPPSSNSPACPQNRVTLKKFVEWFGESLGHVEALKRKGEIEDAVLKVYGPRYSTTRYWLASNLQRKALELKDEIRLSPDASDAIISHVSSDDDDLPF